ncbi:unnamed protein product [Camellia sinensis]
MLPRKTHSLFPYIPYNPSDFNLQLARGKICIQPLLYRHCFLRTRKTVHYCFVPLWLNSSTLNLSGFYFNGYVHKQTRSFDEAMLIGCRVSVSTRRTVPYTVF